jgi:Na+-transporting methylmalonyl-CoA/oxaloacetate decarboxylase gamma subunit
MNGSANFGRRRPPERKAGVAAPTSSVSTSELIAAVGSGGGGGLTHTPLVRQLGGILLAVLAGVGIVFGLSAFNAAQMRGFGKALDQHWKENVGYPGVEDAYKRTAGADASLEAIHNDCKSRSDFVRLDNNQTRALEGFGLYSGEAALAKAAYYVSCLTVEKPARMCHATHRTHLVAALKDYYRLMGRVREERVMSTSGPFAAVRMTLVAPSGRDGRAATPPPPPSARSDERLVHGLRMLITDGYLSRHDLQPVLGSPGDLDLALRGVEPKRAGCA